MHLLPVSWSDFFEFRKNGQNRHVGFNMAAIMTQKNPGLGATLKLIENDDSASTSGLLEQLF